MDQHEEATETEASQPTAAKTTASQPTAAQPTATEAAWDGVEGVEDPEEVRVIFCALDSFSQYARVAHFNVTHLRRRSFYALPEAHWKLLAAPPFSFLDTLDRTDAAIDANAELARAIVRAGLPAFRSIAPGAEPAVPHEWAGVARHADIDKARSTIRQFYRDWTADGAAERAACYGPVMRAVDDEVRRRCPGAPPLRVLVPGAGLGRLVFELCRRGCVAEGNEISYHQLLASSYILNECPRAGAHTIYPWVHTFSNHLTRHNHLRGYGMPDVHPGSALAGGGAGAMTMCAADFLCLYGDEAHHEAYDAVASVFFLDTAPNLIRYLEVMRHCLRPGGVLVNVGPLLWHFENQAPGNHGHDDDGDGEHDGNNSASGIADPGSFELADDEVAALLGRLGFVVERHETGVDAPYIQDTESMLRTVYKASVWVARKDTK